MAAVQRVPTVSAGPTATLVRRMTLQAAGTPFPSARPHYGKCDRYYGKNIDIVRFRFLNLTFWRHCRFGTHMAATAAYTVASRDDHWGIPNQSRMGRCPAEILRSIQIGAEDVSLSPRGFDIDARRDSRRERRCRGDASIGQHTGHPGSSGWHFEADP